MDGFGFDDLEDLIEADIQFGLFENDDKQVQYQRKKQPKKQEREIKSFWDLFKN